MAVDLGPFDEIIGIEIVGVRGVLDFCVRTTPQYTAYGHYKWGWYFIAEGIAYLGDIVDEDVFFVSDNNVQIPEVIMSPPGGYRRYICSGNDRIDVIPEPEGAARVLVSSWRLSSPGAIPDNQDRPICRMRGPVTLTLGR